MKITAEHWFCYHEKHGIMVLSAGKTRKRSWMNAVIHCNGGWYGKGDLEHKVAAIKAEGYKCGKFRLVQL